MCPAVRMCSVASVLLPLTVPPAWAVPAGAAAATLRTDAALGRTWLTGFALSGGLRAAAFRGTARLAGLLPLAGFGAGFLADIRHSSEHGAFEGRAIIPAHRSVYRACAQA